MNMNKDVKEFEAAINALEKQETCEDCISRAEVRRILGNKVLELMRLHTVNPEDNSKADSMAYGVNWGLNTLMELPPVTSQPCDDCISRQAAIDALWKALYEYEDRTEKQFQESDELDISDWIVHRIFVMNISDIDRQTILNLPSVTPKQKTRHWVKINPYPMQMHDYKCSECYHETDDNTENYCSECGARMEDGT